MPYEIEYLETDGGGVSTKYFGIVTNSDIINSISDVEKFDVSPEVMKESAEISKKVSMINKSLAVIAIMPTDLEFGMGRMWQAYSYETGWKTEIVRSRKEAEDWLRIELDGNISFRNSE